MTRRRRSKTDRRPDQDQALRVGIYARVSSGEQVEGHSIEAQLRITREFAEHKGWIVVHEYIDPGFSGTNDERPAFKQIIDDATAGDIQVIAFHKLDRFSRSISDILKNFRKLEGLGILLASATEPFDFTTPHGKAHFHMLAVFAQWYIDNLSAETKKGKKQRALKGLYNGRPPFAYVRSDTGIAQIVPEEAEVVLKAYEAYATDNYTDRKVADLINGFGFPTRRGRNWSKDSVRDFLQNEFYLGKVKYKGDILPGRHDAIISQELFDRCQQVRASHRRAPRSHTPRFNTYVLGKILRCASCGETIRCQSSRKYRYYRDMTNTRGLECNNSGMSVKADTIEKELGAILCNLRLPENWQDEIREALKSEDERKQMLDRRRYLERKLRRLGMSFVDETITEPEYIRERDALKTELATLVISEDVDVIDAGLYLETLRDLWNEATLEEQKAICRLMLKTVYYDLRQQCITELIPEPTFLPLFREISVLEEKKEEIGHFRVLSTARKL
ncbi:MAG: recombinase family protein [Proteobacteria bacterium]|nr:recombinase family protein [Pseudomonadota bacterium]